MSKREINAAKCNGCNGSFLCVSDCPTGYIVKNLDCGLAEFAKRGRCINCGHCNAICPEGAIPYEIDAEVCQNELLKFMSMKRTVRRYDNDRHISDGEMSLIIKAGQSSPTQKNKSTVRIIVIKEKISEVFWTVIEQIKLEVADMGGLHPMYSFVNDVLENKGPVVWGAECLIVAAGNETAVVDSAICAERMQLMAESMCISSAYCGYIADGINKSEELKTLLGIKSNERAHVAFALGKSNIKYETPYLLENKKVTFL